MAQTTMYKAVVNSPEMLLASGITNAQTTIAVTDASAYASATLPMPMTIGMEADAETVLVSNITSNVLTVTRGWQGSAKAWDAGAVIARLFTAYDHDTFKANVEDAITQIGGKAAATHASRHATAGADPIAPADIDAVPTSRTVAGKALASDITLAASDVGAVPTTRTVAGKALSSNVTLAASDVGAEPVHIKASSLSVLTSAWGADSTYATLGYTQKASVAVTGITASMSPRITFGSAALLLNSLAPFCESYAGGVYIWAKSAPTAAVTIDSVEGVTF